MKYYQVVITAVKSFYVKAESREDALNHSAVELESNPNWHGSFDWEHDSTDTFDTSPADIESIKRNPDLAAKDEEEPER